MNENSEDSAAVADRRRRAPIMPDAPDARAFWQNIKDGRYSISDVTADRWDPALYYDPDPEAPDKTYSKIGGWVRDFEWDPLGWKLPIPPRSATQWTTPRSGPWPGRAAALLDYGWPERPLDTERTAVIIGNAMAGEKHYRTSLRINFPEFARELEPRRRSPRCPRRRARRSSTRRTRRSAPPSPPSPRTPCPASWRTSSPAGSPTSSTSAAPTSSRTRPAHRRLAAMARADRGACRRRLRRGDRRRHRPQHGRRDLREVLQDRRAVGHRHPALRRRRRRLRHGRGRQPSSSSSGWPTPSATATASTR